MTKFDKDRLKNLPIMEVADRLGLKIRRNYCLCFLHDEKTPSLHINAKENMWNCFGCGKGGDVIKLVEEYKSCNFIEACKWLSTGLDTANYSMNPSNPPPKTIKSKSGTYYKADSEIYNWFFINLSVTDGVKKFIKERQYPDTIIEQYNLKGLDNCESFFEKCKTKWGMERLLKCGLAKRSVNKTGEHVYKFIWRTNTLFIPFYDMSDNIIYIQGRSLNNTDTKRNRFLNLNKIKTAPFNLPILKTLHKNDTLVITEGVTDCISCCLMGKNAIGIIGAQAYRKEYTESFKDYDIIVIPDNDKNQTGEKFANKVREEFASIGKTINIRFLAEEYKDISEYYMRNCGKFN